MANGNKFNWDAEGTKTFETGVDHGVLFVDTTGNANSYTEWPGYMWQGLTGVTESPSGAENNDLWADNVKYLTLTSAEDFGASLTCYTYPDEWKYCDGSVTIPTTASDGATFTFYQQERRKFGLAYRTKKGQDDKGSDYKYKHHIIYGCSATPSERSYSTVNDSPEAIEFSYEISTIPVKLDNIGGRSYKPTSLITFESNYDETSNGNGINVAIGLIENEGCTLPSPVNIYTALNTGNAP